MLDQGKAKHLAKIYIYIKKKLRGRYTDELFVAKEINLTSLQTLPAPDKNFGIAEKFLNHNLHGQKWLSELDLTRLLEACDIKDDVVLTRLNAADIGMVLHFYRKKQDAARQLEEYRILFLLNKGKIGDLGSQGSHWTQATVVVNPEVHRVEIIFKDSLLISELEKENLIALFEAAVCFNAFSDYQLEIKIESANIESELWSCAYRSLKNLVDDPGFDEMDNVAIKKLKSLPAATMTSNNLRDLCYEILLGQLELIEVNLDEKTEQNQDRLQTQFQPVIQESFQVEDHEKNEIGVFSESLSGPFLIDRDKYLGDHGYQIALRAYSVLKSRGAAIVGAISFDEFRGVFWERVLGGHGLSRNIKFFMPNALDKIHSLPQYFWSGLNIDNLPTGFFVQQHPAGLVLAYDESKVVENKNISPLTSQFKGIDSAGMGKLDIIMGDLKPYAYFKRFFIEGQNAFRELITPESIDLRKKLAGMSGAEKEWWMLLVEKHQTIAKQSDVADLYNGFQYFISRLPKGLGLPTHCPFENTGNMLVCLDRLLSILGKVKPRNLKDQMENLNGLSFEQDGAWYAARWDGYHYFHAAMKLNPRALNLEFEEKILGRTSPSYKVTYEELKKVALSKAVEDFSYPEILFHRYVGGAEYIHKKYDSYLGLIQEIHKNDFSLDIKTKCLALLALVTTGRRGCEQFDAGPFLQALNSGKENLEPMLTVLVNDIDKWEVRPTLKELTSLIRLMNDRIINALGKRDPDDDNPEVQVLKTLTPELSRDTWQALNLWDTNVEHISAKLFLKLYETFEKFDKAKIGVLGKIAAVLRKSCAENQISRLISILSDLKAENNYETILKILSSIDLSKSDPARLPTLAGLIGALDEVKNIQEARLVFPRLTAALLGCHFDRSSGIGTTSFNFSELMRKNVVELNQLLEDHHLPLLDAEMLKRSGVVTYLQDVLDHLQQNAVDNLGWGGQAVWAMARNGIVYTKIINGLKGVLYTSLSRTFDQFPALQALWQKDLFPEPVLEKKYSKINENFLALSSYVANEGELFEILNKLRKKWPDFSLDFLLNSPRTQEFNLKQLKRLLVALQALEVSCPPLVLIEGIFSERPLGKLTDQHKEKIVEQLVSVLEGKEFTFNQRSELIDIVFKTKDSDVPKVLSSSEALPAIIEFVLTNKDTWISVRKIKRIMQTSKKKAWFRAR